jgi:RimJ/RimL family protein N-acetyltransferase
MDILLRAMTESDLPIFYEHQADPEAYRMAAYPSKDWESFQSHWKKNLAVESNRNQTILYQGEVAGYIVSFLMDGKREVGYWLGREFWNQGITSSALKIFLQQEKTRPLYGVVAKHNAGSKRVLEKCGFQLQGEETEEFIFILA